MNAAQPKNAAFAEHRFVTVAACALRSHFVATNQESSNTVIDVIVDRPVGDQTCAVAKVCTPAAQQAVQLVAHLCPRRLIPRNQDFADSLLEP
jgi:hypothetical protein